MLRLNELRGNLTQDQIAKKLGLPRGTYRNYEMGIREPPLELLVRMAQYFNVSVDYLLGNDNAVDTCGNAGQMIIDDAEERELIILFRSITREAKDAIMGNARTAHMLYPNDKN